MSKITQAQAEKFQAAGVQIEPGQLIHVEGAGGLEELEIVNGGDLARLAGEEAFMNDVLQIQVATTTDKMAPPFVYITVNGTANRIRVPRGRKIYAKRMHVEVLARMRQTDFTQADRNMFDPESGNALIPSHGLCYPFTVHMDPSPIGNEWLERILNEPEPEHFQ